MVMCLFKGTQPLQQRLNVEMTEILRFSKKLPQVGEPARQAVTIAKQLHSTMHMAINGLTFDYRTFFKYRCQMNNQYSLENCMVIG